jgi:hypothetical protein
MINPGNLGDNIPPHGKKSTVLRRYVTLENDRSSWRNHWMEISDYILPRRGRFLFTTADDRGKKRNNKIIDSTGTQAVRTLAAGMMSGMTSPARPWFRFATPDENLMDDHEVKTWLADVERIIRSILQRSNFYNAAFTVYSELGAFGTAPLYRQKNFSSVIRFRPFTAGEYVIAENDQGEVDTLGRSFTMTVSQVVEKFVINSEKGVDDWTGVSRATRSMWNQKNYDALVPIIHMIEPRRKAERDPKLFSNQHMPFKSVYMEQGSVNDEVLFEGGFKQFPAYIPRWDVLSGDVYGRSPGMDHLGDIKQLQQQQKRKAQAIDKMVNPPMTAPTSLRGKPSSVLPGGTTYVDPLQGGQGFTPAYQVTPRLGEMQQDISEVQTRIQRGFYADLFAMMINSDRRNITATEVIERQEEKLVLLGPVLQRLNTELLDPLLDDVFQFALDAELLPEPPAALDGAELRVEYISLLAQAQQAVAASALERTMGFTGNLVGVFPDVVDNFNADLAVRQYSEILGNSPDLLKDSREVEAVRQQRAEQQQMQQMQQAAQVAGQAAQGAKVLSETDTQNPNALTELLGRGGSV